MKSRCPRKETEEERPHTKLQPSVYLGALPQRLPLRPEGQRAQRAEARRLQFPTRPAALGAPSSRSWPPLPLADRKLSGKGRSPGASSTSWCEKLSGICFRTPRLQPGSSRWLAESACLCLSRRPCPGPPLAQRAEVVAQGLGFRAAPDIRLGAGVGGDNRE
ncbi:unnamed protein product [Rangifer tarandus platyrhynchus]|uniref:Uncharacterized protein n=2 Tax=Rangifer tarandus platyrhynchus TaxID=3082113 RepID=A0ABN8ZYG0_RANTA|nr:unnamed protein product [Rangifer tarandus platyrhynchus]CAI9711677.1 unnamed protein product [Rangifer tarandus platyrhynchus]